jgi:hypothetical protein
LRELFENIELSLPCQARTVFTQSVPVQGVALRKISKIDQHNWLAPLRCAKGFRLSGLAMACSLRDSLQGSGLRYSPPQSDPTNQLPTSLIGQAIRPPGGSTAYLLPYCNFSRVAQTTLLCNSQPSEFLVSCDLLRISTDHEKHNPAGPVKNSGLLWERALHRRKRELAG